MPYPQVRRSARQELTDRLLVEYAGAIPAGQVLAAVLRAEVLVEACHPDQARRMSLCEELVRHRLAERIARPVPARLSAVPA